VHLAQGPGTNSTKTNSSGGRRRSFRRRRGGTREPWENISPTRRLFFDDRKGTRDKPALHLPTWHACRRYSARSGDEVPQSCIIEDAAVMSYEWTKTEVVFGQQLTAR